MNNIERNALNEQFPNLNAWSKRILLENKEQIDSYKNGKKVEIDNQQVPIDLLIKIIEDTEYYEFALNLFKRDFIFRVGIPVGNEIVNILHYEKDIIIKGIEQLISDGVIPNQEDVIKRFDKIKESGIITLETIKELYGENFVYKSGEEEYSMPCDVLLFLSQMSEEELDKLMDNKEIEEIYGTPKASIKRVISEFLRETLAKKGMLLRKVEISPELREAIFEGARDDYSCAELATHIYIKMCQNLTYNDEFYVLFDDDNYVMTFTSFEKLKTITPESGKNKVICSQYAFIYARLLHEIGIKLSPDYLIKLDRKFGTLEHTYLRFTINEFSIHADATSDFINNDLVNAKVNSPLTGFTCRSKYEDTIIRFEEIVERVYANIKAEEKEKNGDTRSLLELKTKYIQLTNNLKPIDFKERVEVLIDTINKAGLTGLDAFSFLIRIMELCFQSSHLSNNIRIAIVRNLEAENDDAKGMASLIISINQKGFISGHENTTYYQYDPGNPIQSIERDDLQAKCDNETICIANSRSTIPGIVAKRLKDGIKNGRTTKRN